MGATGRVPDGESLRRAALAASWAQDRAVGRQRVRRRWLAWAAWRLALVAVGVPLVLWSAARSGLEAQPALRPAASAAAAVPQPPDPEAVHAWKYRAAASRSPETSSSAVPVGGPGPSAGAPASAMPPADGRGAGPSAPIPTEPSSSEARPPGATLDLSGWRLETRVPGTLSSRPAPEPVAGPPGPVATPRVELKTDRLLHTKEP